ncbi:hypothetical protein BDB01DRAFT_817660, partial [Pilobolus umbonatus]
MAQTMVRESRMENKETDEDVVENRDNDRESSLDSFLLLNMTMITMILLLFLLLLVRLALHPPTLFTLKHIMMQIWILFSITLFPLVIINVRDN